MKLVHGLTAIALISLSGLAAAHPASVAAATPYARAEVRHDRHEIARDEHALMHTRAELARAERAHDFRRAEQLRRELYRQRVALRHDRLEYRHDVRDLHYR